MRNNHWKAPSQVGIVADLEALAGHIARDNQTVPDAAEIVNPPRWLIDLAIERGLVDASDWEGYRDG